MGTGYNRDEYRREARDSYVGEIRGRSIELEWNRIEWHRKGI
jgi:hypothetical protein